MNQPIILRRRALGALLLCMLGVSFLARAEQMSGRGDFTAAEVASLPQYCQDRFNNHRNRKMWESNFGTENYLHLHHFCAGLIYYSRASSEFDVKSRRYITKRGISQFNYVLQRWPADFQLYQQAQMYKQQLEFTGTLK